MAFDSYTSPQNVRSSEMKEWGNIEYKYMKFKRVTILDGLIPGNLYTIQFVNQNGAKYNLWGGGGYFNTQTEGSVLFALGLNNQYGTDGPYHGLWRVTYYEGCGYTFENVGRMMNGKAAYVTPTCASPLKSKEYVRLFGNVSKIDNTGIEQPVDGETCDGSPVCAYDLTGRCIPKMNGFNIVLYSNGTKKKIFTK